MTITIIINYLLILLTYIIWLKSEKSSIKNKKDNEELEEFKNNIKINLLKYDYYGPNETKFNYILNKKDKNNNSKVILHSPDFLIENGILNKYDDNDFQVFNENNTCPKLFIFMIKEAIKVLNSKNKEGVINNKYINDVGIMKFKDQTVGV